jgi:hypothetical protein
MEPYIPPRAFRIPTNYEIESRLSLNAHAGYLLLKTVNSEGRFRIKDLCKQRGDKDFYTRLLGNLLTLGWARKRGDYYSLVAYPAVWQKLGIDRCEEKRLGLQRFRYVKFYADQLPRNRSKAIKKIKKLIEQHVCNRKLAQIKYQHKEYERRLSKAKGNDSTDSTESQKPAAYFGCAAATKLLGYKSISSGHPKRREYFPMKRMPRKFVVVLSWGGYESCRRTCGELAI